MASGIDGRLPRQHLFLAVEHCLNDVRRQRQQDIRGKAASSRDNVVTTVQARLWREDPASVTAMYDVAVLGGLDLVGPPPIEGRHGLRADRMRELHQPLPYRDRVGWTLTEIAASASLNRETLARLMQHHGFLEMVPYGGQQRRRLVTDRAFHAGFGHNVDAAKSRIASIDGMNRAAVFPVFYSDRLPEVLWCLDHAGIADTASHISKKRERLRWLLTQHGYLPDAEIAVLAGYTNRGVEKARASITCDRTFPASAVSPAAECPKAKSTAPVVASQRATGQPTENTQ